MHPKRGDKHYSFQRHVSSSPTVFQRVAIFLTSVLFVASGLSTSTLAEAKEKVTSFTNDSFSIFASDIAHNVSSVVSAAANTAGDAITSTTSTIANSVSSYFATTGDDLDTIRGGGGLPLLTPSA